eukprot:3848636-Pleurochrysis_carterae.AAC.1
MADGEQSTGIVIPGAEEEAISSNAAATSSNASQANTEEVLSQMEIDQAWENVFGNDQMHEMLQTFVVTEKDKAIMNSWLKTQGGDETLIGTKIKELVDEFDGGQWDGLDNFKKVESLPRPLRSVIFARIGQ